MAVERYGSKTDVVVKLILVFFISLLSFSIGTFVGKKFSDNQHKIAKLEPGHQGEASETAATSEDHDSNRGVASVNPKSREVKPDDALSDEEIAKLAEEFVSSDEAPAKPGTAGDHNEKDNSHQTEKATAATHSNEHAAAPAATEHAPAATAQTPVAAHASAVTTAKVAETHQQPSEVAAQLSHNKAPVAAQKSDSAVSRIPSSLPKQVAASPIGKFTVQVAAYASEQEAQTKAADLKTKGHSAFYVPAKVKGQTWYRVSIGLFTTSKEAEVYKRDLTAKGQINSAIVQNISAE